MLTQRNRQLVEILLRGDSSYSMKPQMDNDDELRQFIIGLFELVDDFNTKVTQPSKDALKEHLESVRDYAVSNLGRNSKLVEVVEIEIRNQSVDVTSHTSYYDDLIKLRAAIKWEE